MSESLIERFPCSDVVLVMGSFPDLFRVRLWFEDDDKNLIPAPTQWHLFDTTMDPPMMIISSDNFTFKLCRDHDYQLCTSAVANGQIIATIGFEAPWLDQDPSLPLPLHITVQPVNRC
jgi:hypothetical protein